MTTLTERSLEEAIVELHKMAQDALSLVRVRPTQLLIAPINYRRAIKILFYKGRMVKRAGARGRKHSLNWRIK